MAWESLCNGRGDMLSKQGLEIYVLNSVRSKNGIGQYELVRRLNPHYFVMMAKVKIFNLQCYNKSHCSNHILVINPLMQRLCLR